MATHVKMMKNDSEIEKHLCLKSEIKLENKRGRRNGDKEEKGP